MIRVLACDDSPLVLMGLQSLLAAADDVEIVGVAAHGGQAVAKTAALCPDVVLMDLRMPEVDGVTATRIITDAHPETKVLVITTFDRDAHVLAALRAGASGFVSKTTPLADLLDAVRTVANGQALLSPNATTRLVRALHDRGTASSAMASMTEREQQLLVAVGEGMSNAEIADALTLTPTTVKSAVSRLLAKLGLRDRVHAVILAYELGLVGDVLRGDLPHHGRA